MYWSLLVGWVMGIWLIVPFTHSPVSSFLLFFWYSVFPLTLIFTLFPLHVRVHNHCLPLAIFLSLSPSATTDILLFFPCFIQLYLYGTKIQLSALFCLQVVNKLSDIIAQTILILTKIMLHKRIWLLVY